MKNKEIKNEFQNNSEARSDLRLQLLIREDNACEAYANMLKIQYIG